VSTESTDPMSLGQDSLLELLRRAAEQAGFGITITRVDSEPYRSFYVSELARKILGRSAEELNALGGALAAVAPDALGALLERRTRLERGETVEDVFETVILRPDGERVPIQVALSNAVVAGHRCRSRAFWISVRAAGRNRRCANRRSAFARSCRAHPAISWTRRTGRRPCAASGACSRPANRRPSRTNTARAASMVANSSSKSARSPSISTESARCSRSRAT
jgi:PAS domain S-box-containing protein